MEGVDYRFVSRPDFHALIRDGSLIDWDYLLDNYYGYAHDLAVVARSGGFAIVPVVARMAVRLARVLPDSLLVFLDSPDEVLRVNVTPRSHTVEAQIARMTQDAEERVHMPLFDQVVNDAATLSREATMALLDNWSRLLHGS